MIVMRKGQVKYKGAIMAELSQKRWSHPRPLAFKEINDVLDNARTDFPKGFSSSLGKSMNGKPVFIQIEADKWDSFFEAYVIWFEKWFGEL